MTAVQQTRSADRKREVHADHAGVFKASHALLVAGLLILPGAAIYRSLGTVALGYAGTWMLVLSVVTFVVYAIDKRRACTDGWREPESHLHLLELLGGWPGALIAQRRLRHKSSKGSYQFIFIVIITLHQLVALDALLGWQMLKALFAAL